MVFYLEILMQCQPFLASLEISFYLSRLLTYILAYLVCKETSSMALPFIFVLYWNNTVVTVPLYFKFNITKNMQQQHQHQHQQQQPQTQQKLDRRSAGLEELIMGCTSSTSTKGVSVLQVLFNRLDADRKNIRT